MGIRNSTLRHAFGDKREHKLNHKRSSATTQEKSSFVSFISKKSSKRNNSSPDIVNSRSNSLAKSSDSSSNSYPDSRKFQTSSGGHSFQYRDGRRYHADTSMAYVLPSDDDEADRVHQQHWILRYALQGNYFSPIKKQLEKGINVLDSGCGPATWVFEMGETYPCSRFYGVDASCVFPETIKPANVEFVISNITKEIPYEKNFFDFVHQRLLVLALTDEDWTNALSNLYDVLKPGGYVELSEPDYREMNTAGPAMSTIQTSLRQMSLAQGLPPNIANELKDRLVKAGFVDVVVKSTPIPLNHGGKAGELLWADIKHIYTNIRPFMAKFNTLWEDADLYKAHIEKCSEEVKESKTHIHWQNVYARKPLQPTNQE